jgi:hypothetical protein
MKKLHNQGKSNVPAAVLWQRCRAAIATLKPNNPYRSGPSCRLRFTHSAIANSSSIPAHFEHWDVPGDARDCD